MPYNPQTGVNSETGLTRAQEDAIARAKFLQERRQQTKTITIPTPHRRKKHKKMLRKNIVTKGKKTYKILDNIWKRLNA